MEIDESILQVEVNKIRRKSGPKQKTDNTSAEAESAAAFENTDFLTEIEAPEKETFNFDSEEKELLRIMLTHGNVLIKIDAEDEAQEMHDLEITISEFILFELWRDEIGFENPIHQTVLDEYISEMSNNRIPTTQYFSMSQNPLISGFVINNIIHNYELSSKWKVFGVHVSEEINNVKKGTQHLLFSLKEKKLNAYIHEKQELLKTASVEETEALLKEILHLTGLKSRVNKLLGRIVVK
jgi:hypothetical protein